MKLSNKLIMRALWLHHYLYPPITDCNELLVHAEKHNAKQIFKMPKDNRIDYEDLTIKTEMGNYHCLWMRKKGRRPEKAILYICGGGGVYDYCQAQLFLAKKLLKYVDAEIYYPFYPPSTQYPIKEAHQMIFETYRYMLNRHSHQKIGVVGLSFGATAAMNLISWNNHYGENLPMPALTVGLSPGHVPANRAEREILESYRGFDPFIPVEWIECFGKINAGGWDLESWFIHTAHGDFRKAGKIVLYYGEKETLVYAAPIYQDFLEKAGADYKIHIEPGMPHCYGIGRINKATRETFDEYVRLLNNL